jgi:hypothetical protein
VVGRLHYASWGTRKKSYVNYVWNGQILQPKVRNRLSVIIFTIEAFIRRIYVAAVVFMCCVVWRLTVCWTVRRNVRLCVQSLVVSADVSVDESVLLSAGPYSGPEMETSQ